MKTREPRAVPLLMLLPMLLLVVAGGPAILAQERRGPTTLENLLDAAAEVVPQGTVSRPLQGSSDPAINDAWERYGEAIRAASASLIGTIEKASKPGKTPPDTDAIAGLEAARKGFVDQGRLPSVLDTGLRDARRAAEMAYRQAARALRQQYDAVAATSRKAGRPDEAEALAQEWALLQNSLEFEKEPQLDSTWIHSIANGQSAQITLYSNGTINAPDGPDTWTVSGTTLVIRWRNPDAPGGEWIDTVEVSPHAGSYAGTNQVGTRISGKRVP